MNEIPNTSSILLVEDNQADIDLALYAFKKAQFANPIEVCRDGEEVIEKIVGWENGLQKPICILLDLKMPRINGLEILVKIKEKFPGIPVIMLTSSNEVTDVEKAYSLGANSYIVKPVELDKFIQIAREIKLYWMVLNTSPAG
jgi:CheY-like chemotaxis protein